MEELLKELIKEQCKTNDLLRYNGKGKDPYELLTADQVSEEYDIRNKYGVRHV